MPWDWQRCIDHPLFLSTFGRLSVSFAPTRTDSQAHTSAFLRTHTQPCTNSSPTLEQTSRHTHAQIHAHASTHTHECTNAVTRSLTRTSAGERTQKQICARKLALGRAECILFSFCMDSVLRLLVAYFLRFFFRLKTEIQVWKV